MVDFSQNKALEVKGDVTAKFVFDELVGEPTLIVRPAMEANAPYWNDILRNSGKALKSLQAKNLSAAMLAEARESDMRRYARFVVKDWEHVIDAKGEAVAFTEANAFDFLKSLPTRFFDQLRQFCQSPDNFVETAVLDKDALGN